MNVPYTTELTYTPEGETLVLVNSDAPTPCLHDVVRHEPSLAGLVLREYMPGRLAGSGAPFSDLWVMAAA